MRLRDLQETGVRLAVDDFGTGYSSMAYLQRFPIDVIKIDKSFVAEMTETRESAALVHAMVQMAKALELETIAEGIETEEQRTMLRAEGVEIGQGYLFARPLEAAAIDGLLEDQGRMSVSAAADGVEVTTGTGVSGARPARLAQEQVEQIADGTPLLLRRREWAGGPGPRSCSADRPWSSPRNPRPPDR